MARSLPPITPHPSSDSRVHAQTRIQTHTQAHTLCLSGAPAMLFITLLLHKVARGKPRTNIKVVIYPNMSKRIDSRVFTSVRAATN